MNELASQKVLVSCFILRAIINFLKRFVNLIEIKLKLWGGQKPKELKNLEHTL